MCSSLAARLVRTALSKGVSAGLACDCHRLGLNSLDRRVDADLLAYLRSVLKADGPVHQREQGVIAPHANIIPGADRRPTLPHDDRAGQHHLSVAPLYTEP